MSGDLVPRDQYQPQSLTPLSVRANRELRRLQEAAALRKAEIEAEEALAAHKADMRITAGYALASHTVQLAGQLNREISAEASDNPGTELVLRKIEEDTARAAGYLIQGYMGRRA